jgi:SAM-dependent methyltransferase
MNKFFLDLGKQPLANNYLKKYKINQVKYNLRLQFNIKTKLVSISKRIPSEKMFNDKYPYRSSMSKTMQNSFYKLSNEIKKKYTPKLLLEIGSNDGALINNFKKNKVIGIEPCSNLAKISKKKGFTIFNKYWCIDTAKKMKKIYNEVDMIYSANTITHISNLDDVFKSISLLLSKNGILIIEDPSLLECIKKTSYDQFYNEHIYVFSSIAVKNLLKKYNFEIFDIKNLKTHGGSLRYYIKRTNNNNYKVYQSVKKQMNKEIKYGLNNYNTYKKFGINSIKSKKKLIQIFKNIKLKNKSIIGYGATAKATTILNYCNIDNDLIDYFIDTTPDKKNKFMPGKKIKILKYKPKLIKNKNYIFLGAWNFKDEIFKKERIFINRGGKFITHVPTPRII